MDKIIHYTELPEAMPRTQQARRPIVLVGGCFDILHLGHIRFLTACKKLGTVIVALESDQALTTHKGHLRPIHTQTERAEVLANLESVDHIIPLPHLTTNQAYFDLVKTVSPHIIAVTAGDPQLVNKQNQAAQIGAKIVVIPKINTPSTTQLAKLLGLE